jgi:AcrR family transcriptional regulator
MLPQQATRVKSTALDYLRRSETCAKLLAMTAASLRARVRAEMIDEIKVAARRHLAVDGANLSLRAVARDLGMVSSALYRYFASRDDLLTALIIDAYNALGEAAERADTSIVPRTNLRGRWLAVCHAIRDWALANPYEYALIYGSPVPGYRAPEDTVGPASRPVFVLGSILRDGVNEGMLADWADEQLPPAVHAELSRLVAEGIPGVPPQVLARGMTAWIQLFGAISFELFGRFNNVLDDRSAFFDHQMRRMGELVRL